MRHLSPALAPVVFVVLLGGLGACSGQAKCDVEEPCGGTTTDDRERVVQQGEACLVDVTEAPYGTAVSVDAGESVTIRVAFDACAPCGEDLVSECTVRQDGAELDIFAESSWEVVEGADCPADCRPWFAECTSEPLAAGDYELTYGDGVESFSVPASADIVCVEAG
jgi:hypothetical protein